jgi:hypothetical protein
MAHSFRPGTDQERQQGVRFGPFAKPSANDRYFPHGRFPPIGDIPVGTAYGRLGSWHTSGK